MTSSQSQAEFAESIAREAHAGQVDLAGMDYVEHLKAVVVGVEEASGKLAATGAVPANQELAGRLDTLRAVAWLHDILEDTELTAEDLSARGVAPDVVGAVECMTHAEGEDYFDYICRVKENPLARVVKLSDLANNSDLSRLPEVTDRDLRRLEKYRRAQEMLLE